MEEYIIASGSDLSQYIRTQNRTYNCQVSGGLGIKKDGFIEFLPIQCENIFISIRKISGNGKFVLKLNGQPQDKVVFNVDKIFIPNNCSNIRIERAPDSIGEISILFIGCSIEEKTSVLFRELSKCTYNGIRVIDDKIIANVNSYISGFKPGDEIRTVPEKCYIIQKDRISFQTQCLITRLRIKSPGEKTRSTKDLINTDIKNTKLMKILDTSNQACQLDLNQTPVAFVDSEPRLRKIIYDSNNNGFSNITRQTGGYRLLVNNGKKILSVYAGSELKIPVTTSEGNCYCIEANVRSGSRSYCTFYLGLDNGALQKSEMKCNPRLGIEKFYLNLGTPNTSCKLVVGVNNKQKDFIYIHDLKIFEISYDEYVENIKTAAEFYKLTQGELNRGKDLNAILQTLRLNISQEEKLRHISMLDRYQSTSIDIERLDKQITSFDNFILCIGKMWSSKDYDLFTLVAEAYDINFIEINHYNYNEDHFSYACTKAQNIICDNALYNEIKILLSNHVGIENAEPIIEKIINTHSDYKVILDKILFQKKIEKPTYTYGEFMGNNNLTEIDNLSLAEKYTEEDVRFKIVIPCYNNSSWISKTLDSVVSQKYEKYDVCIVDDCSSDSTGRKIIEEYCKKYNSVFSKWQFVFNKQRKNSLFNIVNGINIMECKDEDVIVNIDGDDWLYDENVLGKVNNVYKTKEIYMTYGQYTFYPKGGKGHCKAIPDTVKRKNNYRTYEWNLSHLRTYKYLLFKNINGKDFLDESGKYYIMAGDLALMFPIAEMSGGKFHFIDEILYVYNRSTSLNDDKVDVKKQLASATSIRRKHKYTAIV